MTTYKLIFKGEITRPEQKDKITNALCRFLKLPEGKGHLLFNGRTYSLKKELSSEAAINLQHKLMDIGVVTRLIKEETLDGDITFQEQASESETGENSEPLKRASDWKGPEIVVGEADDSKPQSSKSPPFGWSGIYQLMERSNANIKDILSIGRSNSNFDELTWLEKARLRFNPFAFIFVGLYYMFKGMWLKGSILLILDIIYFNVLITLDSHKAINDGLFVLPNIIIMMIANVDYYRFKVNNEKIWWTKLQLLTKPLFTIGLSIISVIWVAGSIYTDFMPDNRHPSIIAAEDASGIWSLDSEDTTVQIDLLDAKNVAIDGRVWEVHAMKYLGTKQTLQLKVKDRNGNSTVFYLTFIKSNDDSFRLRLTLEDGRSDTLSFVSDL